MPRKQKNKTQAHRAVYKILATKKEIDKALPQGLSIYSDVIMHRNKIDGKTEWSSIVFLNDKDKANTKKDNIAILRGILEKKTGKPWRIDESKTGLNMDPHGCKQGYSKNKKTKKCIKIKKGSAQRYEPIKLERKKMWCINDNTTDKCINFLEYPTMTALDTKQMAEQYITVHKKELPGFKK